MISFDCREYRGSKQRKNREPLFPYFYTLAQNQNPPIQVQEVELPFGDISFTGQGPDGVPHLVGIERKTILDLLSVMTDGRFAGHQLPGLSISFNSVWLVVEGQIRCGPSGELLLPRGHYWAPPPGKPVRFAGVEHWLATAEVCAGLRIRRTNTIEETARWVFDLYTWWQKDWDDHRSHLAFDDSNAIREIVQTTVPTLLRRFAKELPGIGWVRSKLVEARFGSTFEAVNAGPQEWEKIDGIGKLTAKRVFEAMRTRGAR